MRCFNYTTIVIFCFICCFACREEKLSFKNEVLISSGDTAVLVVDYLKALEIAKTSYPHQVIRNKNEFMAIKKRILAQMIEELVILKVANEKGIVVSDDELNRVVADIKKDFPEDEFENMLVESAITARLWESRLKKRLLMEKVVENEVNSKIVINSSDLDKYYDKNKEAIQSEMAEGGDEKELYDRMLRMMKLNKKQIAYQEWLKQKTTDYSIEVQPEIWEKILNQ